jgi:hypothetical protein
MLAFGEPTLEFEAVVALLRRGKEPDSRAEQALEPEKFGGRYGFPVTLLNHASK